MMIPIDITVMRMMLAAGGGGGLWTEGQSSWYISNK